MTKKIAALFGQAGHIARVYAQGRRERVSELTQLYPTPLDTHNFGDHLSFLRDLQVIFATWGMPFLSPDALDHLPSLEAVFYAAGSVQNFAEPLLERDILVVSAWQANAIPVAEFTLSQILLAGKGYWRNLAACRTPEGRAHAPRGAGNFGATVAVLGAGAIGSRLIQRLHSFALQVIVFDPFLTPEEAETLGVERVTLPEAFARGQVVTNHLANKPETVGLLDEALFRAMRPEATFINTGRGATVDEVALVRVMTERPDLTALLDVTHPEPPAPDSPLYALPNVYLTSHIAGAIGDEVVRLADLCLAEFTAWEAGQPLSGAVTRDMLAYMA